MDYMVYVDNSNDRFSLLDMIERDCEAVDAEEKRVSWQCSEFHGDKTRVCSSEVRQADSSWSSDSSDIKIVKKIRETFDGDVSVNRDPHLLVNPKTVAPIDAVDSVMPVVSQSNTVEVSKRSVEPSAKLIKIEPMPSDCEKFPVQPHIISIRNTEQMCSSIGATPIAPAPPSISSPVSTMQVFIQVASTVGSIVPAGGTVCFVVEPQAVCTTGMTQTSAETNSGSQLADVEEPEKKEELSSEAYEKPTFSYSCLIAMALKNSSTGSLPVNEIYAYILDKFPYFRSAPDGWKNSIRHNLSLNKCFEKVDNPSVSSGSGSRKGCLWGLNPAKADKMDEEISKWIKRASKANGTVPGSTLSDCTAAFGVASSLSSSHTVDITDYKAVSSPCAQQVSGDVSVPVANNKESEYFTMLEDSVSSSDPMLAGLAVQNGLWDDLTETDELMSTAMSFGSNQLTAKANYLARKLADTPVTPPNGLLLSSATSSTCRSFHTKAAVAMSSGHVSADRSTVIVNQPAIG